MRAKRPMKTHLNKNTLLWTFMTDSPLLPGALSCLHAQNFKATGLKNYLKMVKSLNLVANLTLFKNITLLRQHILPCQMFFTSIAQLINNDNS